MKEESIILLRVFKGRDILQISLLTLSEFNRNN